MGRGTLGRLCCDIPSGGSRLRPTEGSGTMSQEGGPQPQDPRWVGHTGTQLLLQHPDQCTAGTERKC